MFESFSPLLHLNDDFFDGLNPTMNSTPDEDIDDWLKPLLLDQLFEHDFLSQSNSFPTTENVEPKNEKPIDEENKRKLIALNNNGSFLINDKFFSNNNSQQTTQRENELFEFLQTHVTEQQIPATSPTTTTTTVRVIHQPKIEPAELPTTVFVNGNELQFHPIVTTNGNAHAKTIGHTYTSLFCWISFSSNIQRIFSF